MMELQRIFKPEYVNYLNNNIIVDNYSQEIFPIDSNQTQRLKGIEKPDGLEKKMIDTGNDKFKAAKLLYEAFENIPPLLASQEAFWIYLTHVDLINYVKKIWSEFKINKDGTTKTEKESITYIKNHWFYSQGSMRTSLMNLWWSVYLTVDNESEDNHKYDLTEIFFMNDGLRTRRLGVGQLGRNREALKGILTFIKDHMKIFEEGGIENRMIWITRHFNFIGGAKPLGCQNSQYFYKELEKNIEHLKSIRRREDVTGPNAFV